MNAILNIKNNLRSEMSAIDVDIKDYKGYEPIASSLGKIIPQEIVAGLIGCIIPESGTNHRVLNKKGYEGSNGESQKGWNCAEGLIQWTFWKYKEPLIKKYNEDKRSTQKLPTTWEEYSKGEPYMNNGYLVAPADGKHIAGLSLDNQMLFLTIYYDNLINKLKDEKDIGVITAKIYQQKAGPNLLKDIADPVERAYATAKKYYPANVNHFLKSLKVATQYCDLNLNAVTPDVVKDIKDEKNPGNKVYDLTLVDRVQKKLWDENVDKKKKYASLLERLKKNLMGGYSVSDVGEDNLTSPSILKDGQESKKVRN